MPYRYNAITGELDLSPCDVGGDTGYINSIITDVSGPVIPNASEEITVTGTNIFSDGSVANTLTLDVQATANTFLVGAGANTAANELGPLTNGQVIFGVTAGSPVAGSIVTANSTPVFSYSSPTLTLDFGKTNLALGSSLSTVSGTGNVCLGNTAGNALTTANDNVFLGTNAGTGATSGGLNIAIGSNALTSAGAAADNIAIGYNAMTAANNVNANSNVAIGSQSCIALTQGNDTVAIGYQSLNQITTGGSNVAVGYQAGTSYTSTESFNIVIGNSVTGTLGESNATRIGSNQSTCYIDGIDNVNVGSVAKVVTMGSNDQLGTADITAGTGITVTPSANAITLAVNGSVVGQTITGNSGGALSPTAGNWNILGSGSITTSGAVSTLTVELTGLTQYNVLVGAGTTTITKVAPSATSGVPLISQGAAANPAFGTAVVAGGGTGNTTFTAYSVICAGTTATGAFQNVSGVGTSGQVLTSNGAAALPTWQAAGANLSLTGNTGGALSPSSGNWNIVTANSTAVLAGSGSTLTLDFGLSNLIIGDSGSITSGAENVGLGDNVLQNTTIGGSNVAVGAQALTANIGGTGNTALGNRSLLSYNIAALTSTYNTAVGNNSLYQLLTGTSNTVIGRLAGSNYTSSESNNICIGESVSGTLGESNVTRIGSSQNACYIDGIDNVNVGNVVKVVTMGSSDQLGTADITAGTGITVSGTANTITINATGSSLTWSNQGSSTSVNSNTGSFSTASITLTLPASPSIGDTCCFVVTTGTLIIQLAGTQVAHLGSASTSATGTLTSNATGDSICLVYQATTDDWWARSSVGTWTLA